MEPGGTERNSHGQLASGYTGINSCRRSVKGLAIPLLLVFLPDTKVSFLLPHGFLVPFEIDSLVALFNKCLLHFCSP